MSSSRRNLSITLPRNFTFHYTDSQGPKTPERAVEQAEPRQPSPPRPRQLARAIMPLDTSFQNFGQPFSHRDVPIPTIETHLAAASQRRPSAPEDSTADNSGYLCPPRVHASAVTPPRTPAAQIDNPFDSTTSEWPDWSLKAHGSLGEGISRPESALSNFSDSSTGSSATSTSFPSLGSSTTSPEGDFVDPFKDRSSAAVKGKSRMLHNAVQEQPQHRHRRVSSKAVWTIDMDQHLWQTYLTYIQDPTVTPFKIQPGSVPPLGVCEKVSRYARGTWKGPKQPCARHHYPPSSSQTQGQLRSVYDEANAVAPTETSSDSSGTLHGDTTPKGSTPPKTRAKWGNSIGQTRKRLRELCTRKAAPTTMKARMLSPKRHAPFQEARSRLFSPPRITSPGITTRDIDISLSTSTASTMKPDGMLAELAREQKAPFSSSENWFGQPLNGHGGPQNIAPLDFGLGIANLQSNHLFQQRLGSPFHAERRTRQPQITSIFRESEPTQNIVEQHASVPDLQILQPSPLSSALKRRAPTQFEDELSITSASNRHNLEQDIFGFSTSSTHRRVRSRGFSLGDVSKSAQPAKDILTPPTATDLLSSSEFAAFPTFDDSPADVTMTSPDTSRMKRLGSPFAEPLTTQSLASHMNEGSNSSAFSIATFPRPQRRKYPRIALDAAFGEAPTTSAPSTSLFGPSLPQLDHQHVPGNLTGTPSTPTRLDDEEDEARRKRMRG